MMQTIINRMTVFLSELILLFMMLIILEYEYLCHTLYFCSHLAVCPCPYFGI